MDYLKVAGAGTVKLANQALINRLKTSVYRLTEEGAAPKPSDMEKLKAAEIPVRVTR